jgi:hypothetical protein
MSDCTTATFAVASGQRGRPRTPLTVGPCRTPRVARHLALVHEIERRVRGGELDDRSDAALALELRRARVSATGAKLLTTEVVS